MIAIHLSHESTPPRAVYTPSSKQHRKSLSLVHPILPGRIASKHQGAASLIIQRQTSLRTNFQNPRHAVQQSLILDRITALQELDIVRLAVDLLCKLSLCHLVWAFFRATVSDILAYLCGDFIGGNDVVGAVDFG